MPQHPETEPHAPADAHAHRAVLDLGPLARAVRRSLSGDHPGEAGTMLPPLIDHHVHLMIVGRDALHDTALAGVVDLGGPLDATAARAARDGLPVVAFAGSFLTARGGYPVGRPWAAEGSAREIDADTGDGRGALPSAAETAVAEQHAFGASVIKVALNSVAGPVFDRATLDAVVGAAHARGLPVVAHVEGEGMSRLAIDAGIDAFAHTPFTERLDAALIAQAAAAGQRWISTLFVASGGELEPNPEQGIALDNLARFHAAGGRVLYGTDLGNGDQPLGVNPAELELLTQAGLGASDLISSITEAWPAAVAACHDGIATFVPGPPPVALDELPAWLGTAHIVPIEDLEQR
jgi:imidazolonepropionase-like amidohydrolase